MILARPRRSRPKLRVQLVLAFALIAAGLRPAQAQANATSGAIRGSVYDKDFAVPLARARVTLVEALLATGTDTDGRFLFERVPPGTYTLSVTKDGYEREIVTDVVVAPGQVADIKVELASEVVDMDELVVKGEDLVTGSELEALEIRAEAVNLQDSVSSELISKAGASDVSGALKLVVGASVVGGKYATVRGLSDRYTGTTLNGIRVPSADPRKRAVQVDLFPTGTIESVTVTKTFTPDLQGDFTGGGVDIRTKSVPEGRFLSVGVATEYFSSATGNDRFLTSRDGGVPTSGTVGGSRDVPEIALQPMPAIPRFSANPSAEASAASVQLDAVTRSFDPVIGTTRDAPAPGFGLSIVGGNRHDIDANRLVGWLAAFTYSRKQDFYEGGTNDSGGVSGLESGIQILNVREDSKGVDELLIGAMGSAVFQLGDKQEIAVRLIANQSAEDEARYQVQDKGYPFVEQNQSLVYTERSLGSLQVAGKHEFGDAGDPKAPFSHGLKLDWFATGNFTRQYQPDIRYFRNGLNLENLVAGQPSNTTDPQRTRRIWRDVEEQNTQAAVNATLPFVQWTGTEGSLKVGVYGDRTVRDYSQDSFFYTFPRQFGPNSNAAKQENLALAGYQPTSIDDLWTDVFLEPNRIGQATNGAPAPNQLLWTIQQLATDVDYDGTQKIPAAYAMTELPLHPKVTLVAGARYEGTAISIVPFGDNGTVETIEVQPSGDRGVVAVPQEEGEAAIKQADLLPSIGVHWEIVHGMKLRGSWSRTIARPTFRELAPVATEEFLDGDEFIGNPDLTLSKVTNLDLRWEWFRRAGEVFAVSVFDKSLTDPIELISFGAGGRSFVQPVNYDSGRVYGYELEARFPFDGIVEPLTGLVLTANYTKLNSEVDVPATEQANLVELGLAQSTRRLQGQPAYVFNFGVTYEHERAGTGFGLFFNRVGETLFSGAARGVDQGIPDVFDDATEFLDLTVTQRLRHGVTLALRARNLTAPDRRTFYRLPSGEEATKTLRPTDRDFRFAVAWKW